VKSIVRLCLVSLIASTVTVCNAELKAPATAEECVCVRRIIRGEIKVSPDGKRVAYLVKAPRLASNENEYQLWVRAIDETKQRSNGVMVFKSSDELSGLAWLGDEGQVALLSRLWKDNSKVFIVNTKTGDNKVVADEPTGINGYSIDSTGNTIAYARAQPAKGMNKDLAAIAHGYSIPFGWPATAFSQRNSGGNLAGWSRRSDIEVLKRSTTGVWERMTLVERKLLIANGPSIPPGFSRVSALSLSPDGEYLAIAFHLENDVDKIPDSWRENRTVKFQHENGMDLLVLGLYDLRSGDARWAINSAKVKYTNIHWSKDSKSLAVFATAPANSQWDKADIERGIDLKAYHYFSIDAATSGVSEILPAPAIYSDSIVTENQNGDMILLLQGKILARMKQIGQEWREISRDTLSLGANISSVSTSNGEILVGIQQNGTTPPDLISYDPITRTKQVLTSLNPDVAQIALGETERIEWTNRYGVKTNGLLIKPVNYESGTEYPLVIMSKGFDIDAFICDTDYQTAFPPQPLAGAGFMVLLAQPPAASRQLRSDIGSIGEAENWIASIEAAVGELERRGLAKRNNVGIIGFSRTSWEVDYMLTHSTFKVKAASSADSGLYNYGGYWLAQIDLKGSGEELYGGPPYGASLQNWIKYSPAFNAENVQAPLLMEYMGEFGSFAEPYTAYEFFTALHRFNKPVDLFFYPNGAHELDTPSERVASLQRNVDWFRFWMQGYEGKPPAYDLDQYDRWRKLREQQERNERMTLSGTKLK
jgi:dipeptidyl aminopeptidase/acylaminoacyl peptidase